MINLLELSAANREKYSNTRSRFDDSTDYCELCGRTLTSKPSIIEVGVDGFEFGTTDETESQGGFLLGPECAKKFPTATKRSASVTAPFIPQTEQVVVAGLRTHQERTAAANVDGWDVSKDGKWTVYTKAFPPHCKATIWQDGDFVSLSVEAEKIGSVFYESGMHTLSGYMRIAASESKDIDDNWEEYLSSYEEHEYAEAYGNDLYGDGDVSNIMASRRTAARVPFPDGDLLDGFMGGRTYTKNAIDSINSALQAIGPKGQEMEGQVVQQLQDMALYALKQAYESFQQRVKEYQENAEQWDEDQRYERDHS